MKEIEVVREALDKTCSALHTTKVEALCSIQEAIIAISTIEKRLEAAEKVVEVSNLLIEEIERLVCLLRKEPTMQNKAKWDEPAHGIDYRIRRAKEALSLYAKAKEVKP